MPSYKNGNYWVNIDNHDGTKIRFSKDDYFIPEFPESMDVKITNCCTVGYIKQPDGTLKGAGCPMCHENSGPNGVHGNIMNAKFIDSLHPYTELAIGGGNPLDHPDLEAFLRKCKDKKVYCNITVHSSTFEKEFDYINRLYKEGLVHGIGVSVFTLNPNLLECIKQIPTTVVHLVVGIIEEDLLADLAHEDLKVLFLGYKNFRRGEQCYKAFGHAIDRRIERTRELLPKMCEEKWFETISFDNLAIKQLNPKSLMTENEWNEFYMGDDSEFTFFIDLVKEEFAGSSTKKTRWPLLDNVEDMFKVIRTNKDCE